ncbi:VOC family protein [Vibrio intestinalis]|uniref:VOC family protein n=1 Tax=Vibrio intestinalis TaxID=2933291 RepID=UPI0021A45D83|nr:VOC family protein [Vibrio intestinalis]
MIAIVGLDHIVLRTTKLQAMLNFYCEHLGCPIERTLPDLGLTQLRAGNCLIDIVEVDSELGKLGGKAPSQNGRNLDHFCLQIEPVDPQALIAWLTERELHFSPPAERYGAQGFGESIYVDDPEGNVVELKPRKLIV